LATLAIGGVLFVFGQRKVPAPIELNDKERLAMGLLMTDPNAASRGAWLYPLHQDLMYRGLSDSEATSVLAELVRKKAIECVEVPVDDPLTGRKDTAPAYRLTPVGADLAAKYADVQRSQHDYTYLLRVAGGRGHNAALLKGLHSLRHVQRQTRFIDSGDSKSSLIKIWSYAALDESVLRAIAVSSGAKVISLESTPH
jgi:hypothetical protein